jgi:deoxyribodipyrimidine photo-lyase
MIPFESMLKSNSDAFKQFGAFYKNAIKHKVNNPLKNNFKLYLKSQFLTNSEFDFKNLSKFYKFNSELGQNGGRNKAIQILKKINKFKDYNQMRNILSYSTTNLSAYLNFGCISIREAYKYFCQKLGSDNQLIKQLYWRDFYLCAYIYLPNGKLFTHMDERYNKIAWSNNVIRKQNWITLINSKTGFLLIDAAMNQMKITGYMHNRARMLVGVFWTKYLLINIFDPQYGSQVGFSKYLVDAIGPSQNKLNHQWITEFDYPGKKYAPRGVPIAGRPMDISNHMITKYDPDCIYIKKWLPHLSNIPNNDLIKWNKLLSDKYNLIHPGPMFDHKLKYNEWINACK